MKEYEVVYIFDSTVADEDVDAKIERYHELLTAGGQGEVTTVDRWGKRQLAYPIRKRTSGNYVVAQLQVAAEALPEFERRLKLDETVLRYLVVVSEGEPTAPMSVATREPRDDDDAEEDD